MNPVNNCKKTSTPAIIPPSPMYYLMLKFSFDWTHLISAYFLLASATVLIAKLIPDLRQLIRYGKVGLQSSTAEPRSYFAKLVALVASVKVPKTWFAHFYIVFALLQWVQLLLMPHAVVNSNYLVVWILLTAQASRRLLESLFLTNWGSSSQMHISHYIVGLLFYVGISLLCYLGLSEGGSSEWEWLELRIVVAFVLFSFDQFQNHQHLALLVKYSVPTFRLFKVVSCAHYLDEIIIYLLVTSESLTRGAKSSTCYAFVTAWTFAVVNLTVSSLETKAYYEIKFDNYDVEYAIVPYVI